MNLAAQKVELKVLVSETFADAYYLAYASGTLIYIVGLGVLNQLQDE